MIHTSRVFSGPSKHPVYSLSSVSSRPCASVWRGYIWGRERLAEYIPMRTCVGCCIRDTILGLTSSRIERRTIINDVTPVFTEAKS